MTTTASIEIVGLGPGDPALLTVGARDALTQAETIILRTREHPGIANLVGDPRLVGCDDLYDSSGTFEETYQAIAERVLTAAQVAAGLVVYAVPGHPLFGERAVSLIRDRAREAGIHVSVQASVSYVDVIAIALGIDPLADQLQMVDAAELALINERDPWAGGQPLFDPHAPLLISQVYSQTVASAAKLELGRVFPDTHPIQIVRSAGVPGGQQISSCALFELDRQPVDHLTSVYVPPLGELDAVRSVKTLQRIIARLRAPGGCPWDREQTHASLRAAMIEEAYETVDAIDAGDLANLEEELGDVLLQVVLHSQIAEEEGSFLLEDVFEALNRKLVRRHPHVFGEATANTAGEVVSTWEAVKATERASSGKPPAPKRNPLDKLPRSMPALERAGTVLAPRKGTLHPERTDAEIMTAGNALLAAVAACVDAGIDPERALDQALRERFATQAD